MRRLLKGLSLLWLCAVLTGCGQVPADSAQESFVYRHAWEQPFAIGGIKHPLENRGEYARLDVEKQSAYSQTIQNLSLHTSGGTIRFRTDAPALSLRVSMRNVRTDLQHMADRGAFGFDVYVGEGTQRSYCGAPMQLLTREQGFCETIALPQGEKEVLIHLPLYAGVSSVEIGVEAGASLEAPAPRSCGAICFYGSSITQGACASRPGLAYGGLLCRMLDADCLNLGFSGAALGEQTIAALIAASDISALVMEYDHNHTVQGLQETHYAFYQTVRSAHPEIPILMLTQPVFTPEASEEQKARQQIIRSSYERAVAAGDENVYYLCGEDFFPAKMRDAYTVDMLHPNDLGHYSMAQAVAQVLAPALQK